MVGFEDLFGPLRVEVVGRFALPGHLAEPLEVVADHAGLRRALRNPIQAIEFAPSLVEHRLGHLGLVDPAAQVLQLGGPAVGLAELLLNGLELLLEVVLALRLVDLLADVGLNLAGKLEDLELVVERGVDLAQPIGDVEGLEQFLFLGHAEREVGRQVVGQRSGLLDVVEHHAGLFGHVGAQLDHLLGGAAGAVHQGFQLE